MSNCCPYCDAKLCLSERIWECDTEINVAGMELDDIIKQSKDCRIRELEQQNAALDAELKSSLKIIDKSKQVLIELTEAFNAISGVQR